MTNLKKELATRFSNPYDNSTSFSFSNNKSYSILQPQDDLLLEKGGIHAISIYKKLLSDSATQSAFSKFSQEITSRSFMVNPASQEKEDIEIKEALEENISWMNFDSIEKQLLEFYITGISIGEVIYTKKDEKIFLNIKPRDQRRFVFSEDNKGKLSLRMLTKKNFFDGIKVPPRKFIFPRYWSLSNSDPYGSGMGNILYPLVKFRRQAIENNLLYSDRYATPTIIIRAPQNATESDMDELESFLENHSSQRAVILPNGFEYEYVYPKGDVDIFKDLKENFANEITVLITGENEVGNINSGNKASSEVANKLRTVRAKEIYEILYEELNNTFVKWFVDANFGAKNKYPTIKRDFSDIEDIENLLTITDLIQLEEKMGIKIDRDWLAERYNIVYDENFNPNDNKKVDWGKVLES